MQLPFHSFPLYALFFPTLLTLVRQAAQYLILRIGEGSRFPYSFSLPLFYADLFFSWENLAHFITIARLSYRAVDFMKVDTSSFIFNYSA